MSCCWDGVPGLDRRVRDTIDDDGGRDMSTPRPGFPNKEFQVVGDLVSTNP